MILESTQILTVMSTRFKGGRCVGLKKLATLLSQLCDPQTSSSTEGLSRTVQGFLSVVRLPKHVVLNNCNIEIDWLCPGNRHST